MKYYDVSFRKQKTNDPKSSYFIRIGRGFPNDKGQITIQLDAMPIGEWDGKLHLFPHEGKLPVATTAPQDDDF